MKKIGLVGGISWVSTVDYYRLINEEINKKLGGLNFAECFLYSLNFGDIQRLGWENSLEPLKNACTILKKSGAELIGLCANTAHMYADVLEEVGIPIVHIATEIAKTVRQSGLRKVALLGTKYTMEKEFYRKKLEENGLEVLVPAKQETRDYIQYTVKEELGRGLINAHTKKKYLAIAEELIQDGAEGIILGCTEIPLLISQQDFSVPVFDTTKIHCQAIVQYSLSN